MYFINGFIDELIKLGIGQDESMMQPIEPETYTKIKDYKTPPPQTLARPVKSKAQKAIEQQSNKSENAEKRKQFNEEVEGTGG